MNKIPKILILVAVLSFCLQQALFAQNNTNYSVADDFERIKSEIHALLQRNKELEIEQGMLKQEYSHLRELLKIRKKGLQAAQKRVASKRQDVAERTKALNSKSIDLLINESKTHYLTGQSADMDVNNSLWMLKLADLKYEKKSLEMELGLKELQHEDMASKEKKEIKGIEARIRKNISHRDSVEREVDSLQVRVGSLDNLIQEAVEANVVLEEKVAKRKKEVALIKRENAVLKKKMVYSHKLTEPLFGDKKAEYTALGEVVLDLEREYEKLNRGVVASLSAQEAKGKYMKQVVKIDRENQELRIKIAQIQSQLEKLK